MKNKLLFMVEIGGYLTFVGGVIGSLKYMEQRARPKAITASSIVIGNKRLQPVAKEQFIGDLERCCMSMPL